MDHWNRHVTWDIEMDHEHTYKLRTKHVPYVNNIKHGHGAIL